MYEYINQMVDLQVSSWLGLYGTVFANIMSIIIVGYVYSLVYQMVKRKPFITTYGLSAIILAIHYSVTYVFIHQSPKLVVIPILFMSLVFLEFGLISRKSSVFNYKDKILSWDLERCEAALYVWEQLRVILKQGESMSLVICTTCYMPMSVCLSNGDRSRDTKIVFRYNNDIRKKCILEDKKEELINFSFKEDEVVYIIIALHERVESLRMMEKRVKI